ncbi:c-type cytochrome [Limnohabitans sp. Bal53]|uniref:c-type cytochrome n=1 Tax=Limnohabitans sp. Bal53 TaxID=1977910 RepID=UPI000D36B422|nr:c-type cytochrome [Limnohabitans sp. Bal53]PUE39751.1 cytochrome C [Limnohabitans sp. Bal53]
MIGLYPTWFEPGVGSGWVVGLIATIHVLFSHTSVGAAIFFAWLANHAHRHNKPELLEFIRRYGLFLLVFSYVLGSITGPGIWFATTVASPRGISALIHSFVWMWATEWVFFVIEVVGVYMLVYLAGRIDVKTHTRIAVIFGLTSYTTMLVIVGILSFMMWPGNANWTETGGVLNAFFGPNTFAQLGMRTAFMFTITAVVGGIVVGSFKDLAVKKQIGRQLAVLGMAAAVIGALMLQWYLATLPETAEVVLENRLPAHFPMALMAAVGGTIAYFLLTLVQPRAIVSGLAGVMTVVILVFGLWPEEVARESIRKPWVAGQYVYSNQVVGRDVPGMGVKSEIPTIEAHGFLKTHVFMPEHLRTVTDANRVEAGRALALATCSNCHSLSSTGMRPLAQYFVGTHSEADVATYLQAALSGGNTLYMPQVPLNDVEARALAAFIQSIAKPLASVQAVQAKE